MAQATGLLETAVGPDGTIRTEASLMQINDIWFYAVPGELLLSKLGLHYRQVMKIVGGQSTVIIGLANDELGYILPAADFVSPQNYRDPGPSYEESISVSAQTGPALTRALHYLLKMEIGDPKFDNF